MKNSPNRLLARLTRDRMARTGESYNVARRAIFDHRPEQPTEQPTEQPVQEER